MTETHDKTLNDLFADLHAHRIATMDPAALRINIDQRRTLVETARRDQFVKAGNSAPRFELENVEGGALTREALTAQGPLVLVFFRFATCPACNIALPYYNRVLAPALAALGAHLVAVSPQIPERLIDIKQRHNLGFTVATDRDNTLGRAFGILYTFDEASQRQSLASGRPIGDVTGTGAWELPMPAVIVINRDGVVAFADVSPDWLVRTEVDPILDAVRRLVADQRDAA